ncbi:hypothetical protein O181_124762 [Austropuccinia psidii MF-1]|uniref:Uncharacterized protein n=1 Tax=Austropuccinia psidii MF-1 TaxID=1389203 RepID=A0A9Q3KSP1_9BASI|nr:hypothetical protein [Austropuccinia psidii MF-1]
MFSGPNPIIPNQGPKIHHQFQRRNFQPISLAIHGSYQKTFPGPQPPGPAGVGLAILSGLFQVPFSEVIHHSIICQGSKYFNTPWTTQLPHIGSNNATCMSLAQSGQFIFYCGNSIAQINFQDGQDCIGPIQTIQPVTHLLGSFFQRFTYTGHLSSPGDFFPS